MSPKNKLHALVDACEDDAILESAIALLSNESEDWWATLPDIEKEKTYKALEQLDNELFVPHVQVMQQAWKRIGK
jgi:hypothetical protein